MPRSRRLVLWVLCVCILVAPPAASCQRPSGLGTDLNAIVAPYRFSALAWEACALLGIGCNGEAQARDTDLDDAAALEVFFDLAAKERAVERRMSEGEGDGAAEVRQTLRAELADLKEQRAALRGRVESAIARQIRATLDEEGILNPFQRLVPLPLRFPPVGLRLDSPPTLLVISPRERIESVREVMLVQGMPAATREEIETAVAELGYSALVVDLGGLAALYPPLIDESASLAWTVETATHEWLHQYLAFTPLGSRYVLDLAGLRPDYEIARMNETVAGMMGRELARCVMDRYHPEPPPAQGTPEPPPTRDRSLFNRTMRETRLRVDELLAAGHIEEAETYMEQQRRFLASEGFHIRKLNQAYFAFHGTYADAPTSVDPIGEEMRALRRQVASPREFLDAVTTLTSRAELQERLAADG